MPPAGFEPTISSGKRPKTNALDRVATGTGIQKIIIPVKGHNHFNNTLIILPLMRILQRNLKRTYLIV